MCICKASSEAAAQLRHQNNVGLRVDIHKEGIFLCAFARPAEKPLPNSTVRAVWACKLTYAKSVFFQVHIPRLAAKPLPNSTVRAVWAYKFTWAKRVLVQVYLLGWQQSRCPARPSALCGHASWHVQQWCPSNKAAAKLGHQHCVDMQAGMCSNGVHPSVFARTAVKPLPNFASTEH
eukprot:1156355-Pelagomonas_calceolata.AAC.5